MAKNFITDDPGLDSNLEGTDGKDVIEGLDGEDVLYGFAGNDILHAGPAPEFGYDQLFGGKGKDIFVFESGDGQAQIEDFSRKDGLDLSGTNFSKRDLKDTFENDRDGDGNYVRETSANGKPETALRFDANDSSGFDSLNIIGVTAKDILKFVKHHPEYYDFG